MPRAIEPCCTTPLHFSVRKDGLSSVDKGIASPLILSGVIFIHPHLTCQERGLQPIMASHHGQDGAQSTKEFCRSRSANERTIGQFIVVRCCKSRHCHGKLLPLDLVYFSIPFNRSPFHTEQ